MIPHSLEGEVVPAISYAGYEGAWAMEMCRTDIDGGDQEHYQEDCEIVYRRDKIYLDIAGPIVYD